MTLYRKCWKSTRRLTMPYTPKQNGAAEQENRTIEESARSMFHASGLPKERWKEACNTTVYILNRTGPTPVEVNTPLELWTGSYATLGHLRVCRTDCYVYIHKEKRHKWDQKSNLFRLLGYIIEKDGYRIWIPKERSLCLSVMYTLSQKLCAICATTSPNRKHVPYSPCSYNWRN